MGNQSYFLFTWHLACCLLSLIGRSVGTVKAIFSKLNEAEVK